ncbi:hypothetical protein JCM16775_1188 [Leptotrichia hofstadii]|uniref:ATPase AAA-type core domain-containing protein n=1 Tax=Leptotrichia hofstadii TaxID=157688 RepID=A0A510JGN0_9FUSO|nr:AAA family ATPase [Leptotrichia hofstadii]BBM38479.1 hypothetical protein JCM16775_1188 [Leptotrichia hofstadii]
MFPIYMYVKEYKGLKDFEITFDNNYEIKYNRDKDTLSINKKYESANNNIENFYSIDKTKGNIDSANLLIGKNGSGKTSILEVLNIFNLGSSNDNEKIQEIGNHVILYKSSFNNEDFILEKDFLSISIEIKESKKEIKLKEVLSKCEIEDEKNYKEDYLKNLGTIKLSFREKKLSAAQRELLSKYVKERTVLKLNIGLENGSKKNIYDYLIKIRQEKNNDNFENAYLTLSILDLYVKLINSNKEILNNFHFDKINLNFLKLYDNINNDNIKDIILKNYFNYLYLIHILRDLYINNGKENSIKKLEKDKNKMLELLNDKSSSEKFEILLKRFERLSRKSGNQIAFNRKNYKEIIDDIATRINDIVAAKDEINIQYNKIIKKFIINFKEREEIIDFLEEYDNFYIPKEKKDIDLLFKSVEFIKIEEEGLSDGERIKLQYFSTLHGVLNAEFKDRKYITLLFDEIESFLHPEWSRRFLYELIEELERYEDKKFKLIFATHSPFLIADVLARDCIYLNKDEEGKIQAEIKEDVKTFGANIIDLFKNTMFLESTFGKFATEKIKGIVHKIEKAEKYSDIKHEVDFIIGEIGEKLISNKLKSMIESKFENKDEEYYRKKIEEYQTKLEKLRNKENNKNSEE